MPHQHPEKEGRRKIPDGVEEEGGRGRRMREKREWRKGLCVRGEGKSRRTGGQTEEMTGRRGRGEGKGKKR